MDERQSYIRKLLEAYRTTPGTTGTVRSPDRQLARQLYDRGVPLTVVENALILATARRLRDRDQPPLPTIRSLAYFRIVIDEVLALNVTDDYFHFLRLKLKHHPPST